MLQIGSNYSILLSMFCYKATVSHYLLYLVLFLAMTVSFILFLYLSSFLFISTKLFPTPGGISHLPFLTGYLLKWHL